MTLAEMTDLLGLRMEDSAQTSFPLATKIKALNVAQRTAANFLDEAYLTELEVQDVVGLTGLSSSTAYFFLDGTGAALHSANIPLRNSIRQVQVSHATGVYKYCVMIPFSDVKKLENSNLAYGTDNPVAWVWGTRLYVRPITTDLAHLSLYYLKEPTAMESSGPTNSILNVSLHEIIVDFAESQLWRMDNKVDRATAAYSSAMESIKMLNQRYVVEAPIGIGTQSDRQVPGVV